MDHADIADRFRYVVAHAANGLAVIALGRQGRTLEMARQDEEKRREDDQKDAQAGTFVEDDKEDADELEAVGQHAYDAVGVERVDGVAVVDEDARNAPSRVGRKIGCRQAVELGTEDRAQAVRNLLAENGNGTVLRRFKEVCYDDEKEVEPGQRKGDRLAGREAVDDFL